MWTHMKERKQEHKILDRKKKGEGKQRCREPTLQEKEKEKKKEKETERNKRTKK